MNKHFTPNANGALQEKLIALLGKSQTVKKETKTVKENKSKLTPIYKLGVDGVDHINVYGDGATVLGQLLSFDNNLRFSNSHLGPFNNIVGLMRYITVENCPESVRSSKDTWVRHLTKGLTHKTIANLHAIVMDSVYQRIAGYPILKEAVVESTLPFEMYYEMTVENGTVVKRRPGIAEWVIEGLEEIRAKLKTKSKPNFKTLMSKPDVKLYEGIDKYVRPRKPTVETKYLEEAVNNSLTVSVTDENAMQIEHGKKMLEIEENAVVAEPVEEIIYPTGTEETLAQPDVAI